ncbi:HAD family hydrolase [Paenibacillus agricola]|uniref:HAD family hydrolase n=1 Tax=Paenibacillus agricola TaxID=2716264 RepID=A0ABX0J6R9_9BACL|nr:HAD family hydrolase [Paenibacillus agricola]NHN30859.1 HAD family hydrolase [Paenibacillus agricola]
MPREHESDKNNKQVQGIIFDMDNTLLQSSINFVAMKQDIFTYLSSIGAVPANYVAAEHTTATLIAHAKLNGLAPEQEREVWQIASKHELLGMVDAGLEPGVEALLGQLHRKYVLVIVTNNALEAAQRALNSTGISRYFDLVVGRELASALKPSPAAFHYVLDRFPQVASSAWLSIGDSWIDGVASREAGIRFISYQADLELMKARGVQAIGHIHNITELIHYLDEPHYY